MFKQLLHLYSIDGFQNYDPILKGYYYYYTNILINKPISNIKEIALKSIEMPLFFNNTRTSNNSNLFGFKFDYDSYFDISMTITIPESNYTSITSLIDTLNISISITLTYNGISIVLYTIGDYNISLQHNCSSFTINKSILANNILGFNTGTYTTPITTANFYCLNIDNYLTMYITNLNSGSDTNANGRLLTFKIILLQTNGNILF